MSDPNRIEEMIAAEPDPKNRAYLLILNNINKALVENTEATREIRSELAAHVLKFEAHTAKSDSLVNQGRGAWKVAAWIFGTLQVIGLGMWSDSRKEQKELVAAIQQERIEHARIGQRLDILERKK